MPSTGRSASVVWGVADSGEAVEVDIPSALLGAVEAVWPPAGLRRSERNPGRVVHHLVVDDRGEADVGQLVARAESDLALFAAERIEGLVAVHAAAVVLDESLVLLPGHSYAGKSTFCMAAHEAGGIVLSDEYALIEPATLLVTGWPRPVRLRRADGGIDRVDVARPHRPTSATVVASVHFDPSQPTDITPASAGETTLAILANTVCARSRPDEAFTVATGLARATVGVAGSHTDARELVDSLRTHVQSL